MKLTFTKMHGLGNDFIVIDSRVKDVPNLPKVLKRLGDRRFGVGFDQALILKKSKKADFRMDIYNSDGTRVEMCGNGIRCFASYIWSRKLSKKDRLEVETLAGIIKPEKAGSLVKVDMGEPVLEGSLIPTTRSGPILDFQLEIDVNAFIVTCVSMGNPHCVVFVADVDGYPVADHGQLIETNPFFPKRTNVEFIEVKDAKTLKMRVWERGSGETLACGTGACAATVAASLKGLINRSATVLLPGGKLKINWARDNHVYMTGPATEVFTGTVEV
ncbi:MAG: diaminopimelate epimerase [Deltaproteobacteria bacterium RIFCSPLOWO2_02_FULL_53_8]|nr:MAG: diaminopimelate epimerase [Deltaproteobacteria bacterium RIFCSPLOWO2_02_FULL_53_8]